MKPENIKVFLKELNYSDEAIKALFSERVYQDKLWQNKQSPIANNKNSEIEYLVLIQDYITEAIHIVARTAEPKASLKVSHLIRKISGLALSSAEKNNSVEKDLNELEYTIIQDDVNIIQGIALMQHYINEGFKMYSLNHMDKERKIQINVAYILAIGMKLMSLSKDFAPTRNI